MKVTKFQGLVAISIGMVFLFIAPSHSTTMLELSLEDMCLLSTDIVIARTLSINSYIQSDSKRIFSDIKLEITNKIKGRFQKQDRLTLTYYGGKANGRTTIVVGAPQFTVGEQSLLFLSEQSTLMFKPYLVVGLTQGKFNIFTDSATGEQKIKRDRINVPLQVRKNGSHLDITDSKPLKLVDFINQIRIFLN